jgi:single-strand DNA-binding protein
MNVCKVILVGRVGKDASMKYTPSGQAVTQFSLAVSDNYTNAAGEKVKKTTWLRISTWGKLAENCNQYVKKGMELYVEGKLTADDQGNPRTYESNGVTKATFEVNASTVQFGAGGEKKAEASAPVDDMDDVPF